MTDPAPELKFRQEYMIEPPNRPSTEELLRRLDEAKTFRDREDVRGELVGRLIYVEDQFNALSADLAKLRAERDDLKLIAFGLASAAMKLDGWQIVHFGGGHPQWCLQYVTTDGQLSDMYRIGQRYWLNKGMSDPTLTPEARAVLAEARKLNQGEAK